MGPDLKSLIQRAALAIGGLSGVITIKNEYKNQDNLAEKLAEKAAELQALEEKFAEAAKQATNERTVLNFIHKLHLTRIKNEVSILVGLEKERSEILERVKERNVKWTDNHDNTLLELNNRDTIKLQELTIKCTRASTEVDNFVEKSQKFQ